MPQKIEKAQISSINIRIHPALKVTLDQYCEEHIEKIAEAVTSAIKGYIGFGKPQIDRTTKKTDTLVDGKGLRLDIRVHSRLKKALQEYCEKNAVSITEVVTGAIIEYIEFKV